MFLGKFGNIYTAKATIWVVKRLPTTTYWHTFSQCKHSEGTILSITYTTKALLMTCPYEALLKMTSPPFINVRTGDLWVLNSINPDGSLSWTSNIIRCSITIKLSVARVSIPLFNVHNNIVLSHLVQLITLCDLSVSERGCPLGVNRLCMDIQAEEPQDSSSV